MTIDRLRLGLAAALLIVPGPLHGQGGPPVLDIEAACRSAGSTGIGSEKEVREGCLRSEREARDEAKRRWGEFGAEAKTQCSKQSELGGSPGYVELVTCLELAGGSAPIRSNPRQRTDPMEVLDKPSGR